MMKLFQKQNGVISIFLAIVLVPMLLVSAVFVDSSRLQLAKSMAASAGDLTMNAALANYDSVLKDLYGLFATSQNLDDMMDNLRNYYKNSMIVGGVEEAAADDYVQRIINWLSNKPESGLDDIMKISLSDDDIKLTGRTDASLMNPVMLKSQIVEFMKYRAPIDLASTLLEALDSLTGVDKQTDTIKKKSDFLDEQAGIIAKLEKAWKHICTYQYDTDGKAKEDSQTWDSKKADFPQSGYFSKKKQNLEKLYRDLLGNWDYDNIYYCDYNNSFLTKALQFRLFDNETYFVEPAVWFEKRKEELVYTGEATKYSKQSPATDDDLLEIINAYITANKLFQNPNSDYHKTKELYQKATSSLAEISMDYKIALIFWVNDRASIHPFYNYEKTVMNLAELRTTLESAIDYHSEEAETTCVTFDSVKNEWVLAQEGDSIFDVAKEVYNEKAEKDFIDKEFKDFYEITTSLKKIYQEVAPEREGVREGVLENLRLLINESTNAYNLLIVRTENLRFAIEILSDVKKSLSEGEYKKKIDAWKTSAEVIKDTSFGQSELEEIERNEDLINVEEVGNLIERLTNAMNSISKEDRSNNIIDSALEAIKLSNVRGATFYEVEAKYETKDANLQWFFNNKILNKDIRDQLKKVDFSEEETYDLYAKSLVDSVSYHPIPGFDLEKSPHLNINEPKLFTWLENTFGKDATVDEETQTKSKDDLKKNGKKAAEDKINNLDDKKPAEVGKNGASISKIEDRSLPAPSELPSAQWYQELEDGKAGKSYELSSFDISKNSSDSQKMLGDSSSGLQSILGVLKNASEDLRDGFYLVDYVMQMFSYNSMEAEATFEATNSPLEGSWWSADSSQTGAYKAKDSYRDIINNNKSLTQNEISPNTNYLYGKEVEYILYGNENGVSSAYGSIYLIRFGLNLVYAFTDAEIQAVSNAFAAAVAWLPILVPVVKLATIVALALAESAWDIYLMSAGRKVSLWKTADTWVMKPSGAAKEAAKVVVSEAVEYVAEKAKDGIEVVMSMTDEELSEYLENNKEYTTNLAHKMVDNTVQTIQNAGKEALDKLVEICQYERAYNDAKNKTEELAPKVKESLRNWLATQKKTDSDIIFKAKEKAVEFLINGSENAVENILKFMEEELGPVQLQEKLEKTIKDLGVELDKKIKEFISSVYGSIDKMKSEAINTVKKAAQDGVDSLKNSVKGFIFGKIGDGNGVTSTSSVVSSLLNWGYSDYLTLFLFVAAISNEEVILLRIADVITMNMRHINGQYVVEEEVNKDSIWYKLFRIGKRQKVLTTKEGAFSLAKAYTYVNLEAKVEVKPWLLALPILSETTEKLNESKWYVFPYSGILGY